MARLINYFELKQRILEERDKIPKTLPSAIYEFGIEKPNHHGNSMRGGIRIALRCLEQCQTVMDTVEVVRCKDCIHWYDREETCLKIYSDGAVSPYAWQFRKPDDFCSYGEIRTN